MREAILVADGGGTSVKWGQGEWRATSGGCNPATGVLPIDAPQPPVEPVGGVYFYGAGCLPHLRPAVESWLRGLYPIAREIVVDTDLAGAARALWGDESGIAAILGTGSASCLWDGHGIARSVPSLGFILGDEGSGAVMGRALLNAYFKGLLPADTAARFASDTGITLASAIEETYRTPAPARELAKYARWLADNRELAGVGHIIDSCLNLFVERNLRGYGETRVAASGSIAVAFEPELRRALERAGMTLSHTLDNPLNALVDYHERN